MSLSDIKLVLRKFAFPLFFGTLLGFSLIIVVRPTSAGAGRETRVSQTGVRQVLITHTPASTQQPTPAPASGRLVRITPELVGLFVVGVLITLAMVGIGLGLGFWMKQHDKT